MDVVIRSGRHHQEWNSPQHGKRQTSEDNVSWESSILEELANGQQVRDAGNGQTNQRQRATDVEARTGN
jgi:hypothetical protein